MQCGPPQVRSPGELGAVLRAAAATSGTGKTGETGRTGGWVRGVGYHDCVAGPINRHDLDAVVPDTPVRIQHRSGALWMLNSAGLAAVGLADSSDGRLFRMDDVLRERLPEPSSPSLAPVGAKLASFGVTGVTDMTATTGASQALTLTQAVAGGALRQRLVLTGGPDLHLPRPEHPLVQLGPVKIVLDDDLAAVGFDELVDTIGRARAAGRRVAVHCVTRTPLAVALAA
nr:amidohydrolase family protein [Micromonospora sp. DSM 115978]